MISRNKVERATVRTHGLGGQGVLVPGNLILTAAHCIGWTAEGYMTLDDGYVEEIQDKTGIVFKTAPLAVEPVSDMAVLGALDNQVFGEEVDAFERWCASVDPVPIATCDYEPFAEFPVYVRSHQGSWIAGRAQQCSVRSSFLFVDTDDQIEQGTSGGPIVDERGHVVAIVSQASDAHAGQTSVGRHPRPYMTLSAWVIETITDASQEHVRLTTSHARRSARRARG